MLTSQRFPITDDSQVGETRRAIAEICRRNGMPETEAGKLAIVVTELGRNLVRHGGGGELIAREIPSKSFFGMEILTIDRGSGIANIGEAFRDGFSTGGTAGTGLGAVKRLSNRFDVFSQIGKGTIVCSFVGAKEDTISKFQIGAVSVPMTGEDVCGDRWDFLATACCARLMLADGLGHGPFAEEAAREAVAIFRANSTLSPAPAVDLMHLALAKTRGAAGAMVSVDLLTAKLTSAGIGNISMRIVTGDTAKNLISDNGTLGGNARKARPTVTPWSSESLLVMHSDGLGSRWNISDYPGLSNRQPSIIAAVLYRDHRRERDDVTVVVMKGSS